LICPIPIRNPLDLSWFRSGFGTMLDLKIVEIYMLRFMEHNGIYYLKGKRICSVLKINY